MEIRRILASNIVRLRRGRGLSQEALAWEARVSRRYMARIEGGQTSTGLDVIAKLAAVLKVDPDELLRPPPRRQPKARSAKAKR
jgi:transcriptional regulator with XRE-family HTH domain